MSECVCVRMCVKTGLVVAQGLRYGVKCILEASKLTRKWDFETMDWGKKLKDALAAFPFFSFLPVPSHPFSPSSPCLHLQYLSLSTPPNPLYL